MNNQNVSEENWEYYIGNHEEFWSGPILPESHPMYKQVKEEIDRLFHPYNICAEVTDHYTAALVGKPFSWSLKNKNGESSDEAEAIIKNWFEWQTEVGIDTDLGDPLSNAITQMLVRDQGDGAGVGYLRLYEPSIYSQLEPYQRVVVHAPAPGTVYAERNVDGILFKAEYTYGEGEKEIYELQPDGKTKITNDNTGEFVLADYGGRLPIIELKGRAIINKAIKRGQDSINKTLTIKDINVESAGFLERIILNALPPGEYVENEDGTKTFKRDTKGLDIGANLITMLTGIPLGDPDAPEGYTNPSVHYRNPVPVETFRESIAIDVSTIYFQAGLAYLLSSGDGKISGKSRLTLKEDFLVRLRLYEQRIEAALRKMLSIVIKNLSEYYPILADYKPVVELNLAVSPLPEERQQNREDVKTGIMSIPSAISANGVDVQKEIALIEKYLPILAQLQNALSNQDKSKDTNAEENVDDRLREKAKGNSASK